MTAWPIIALLISVTALLTAIAVFIVATNRGTSDYDLSDFPTAGSADPPKVMGVFVVSKTQDEQMESWRRDDAATPIPRDHHPGRNE